MLLYRPPLQNPCPFIEPKWLTNIWRALEWTFSSFFLFKFS